MINRFDVRIEGDGEGKLDRDILNNPLIAIENGERFELDSVFTGVRKKDEGDALRKQAIDEATRWNTEFENELMRSDVLPENNPRIWDLLRMTMTRKPLRRLLSLKDDDGTLPDAVRTLQDHVRDHARKKQ